MKAVLIILFLSLAVPLQAADIEVTIHVDGDYRPFSYSENGEARGMYVDVLRAAFSKMKGFKVTLIPVPWKRGKVIMQTGKGFGLTPAFFHGHDWPYLYPYSLPFYVETVIAVCQETILESPKSNWPHDYIGLTIGNVAGFDGWGGAAFRTLVEEGLIGYEEAKGSKENILKLLSGRLDCIMMEEKAFDFLYAQLKRSGAYQAGRHQPVRKGAIVGQDPVYIGYSKPAIEAGMYPYSNEFRQAFDSVVYTMAKNGEIKRIMDAYRE